MKNKLLVSMVTIFCVFCSVTMVNAESGNFHENNNGNIIATFEIVVDDEHALSQGGFSIQTATGSVFVTDIAYRTYKIDVGIYAGPWNAVGGAGLWVDYGEERVII